MVIELPVYSDSCVPGKKSPVCCALQGDLINIGELVHELLVERVISGPLCSG